MASRDTRYTLAMNSAASPIDQFSKAHHRPSFNKASVSWACPKRRLPVRPSTRKGARLMLSMPPATNRSPSPARMAWAASMAAFKAEPHTLLTVKAPTDEGNPAWMAAWRAGFCPRPAETTLPMMTSLISAGLGMPARSTAAFTTQAPKSTADRLQKPPWKLPDGVRTALKITASVSLLLIALSPDCVIGVDSRLDRARILKMG